MTLEALGKSSADYKHPELIPPIAKVFKKDIDDKAAGKVGSELAGLRLPDYVAMAAIAWQMGYKTGDDAAILKGGNDAFNAVPSADAIAKLAADFGAKATKGNLARRRRPRQLREGPLEGGRQPGHRRDPAQPQRRAARRANAGGLSTAEIERKVPLGALQEHRPRQARPPTRCRPSGRHRPVPPLRPPAGRHGRVRDQGRPRPLHGREREGDLGGGPRHGTLPEMDRDRVAHIPADGPLLSTGADALGLIYGDAADWVAVPATRLDPAFFDLKSGVAGEFVQKFVNYRQRLAIVGDIGERLAESNALRDFVRESNRGRQLWFVADADGSRSGSTGRSLMRANAPRAKLGACSLAPSSRSRSSRPCSRPPWPTRRPAPRSSTSTTATSGFSRRTPPARTR